MSNPRDDSVDRLADAQEGIEQYLKSAQSLKIKTEEIMGDLRDIAEKKIEQFNKANARLKLKRLKTEIEMMKSNIKMAETLRGLHGTEESQADFSLRASLRELEHELAELTKKVNPKRWWQFWRRF